MAIAVLALVGALVSLYLTFYKLGWVGSLACGPGGGCAVVQSSPYAVFLGVPVPLWGLLGYLALLGLALYGLRPGGLARPAVGWLLLGWAALAAMFTAYLSYLEAFVIRAWCRWCLVSAGLVVAIAWAAWMGRPRERQR
jgi:uncharacterized membrane protein